MSKKLPYYKMYPADFETDEKARLLTFEEKGFYLECLNVSWLNGGSLPKEVELLARSLRQTVRLVRRLWKTVGVLFVEHPKDVSRVVNPRQWKEFCAANGKVEAPQEAAKIHRSFPQKTEIHPTPRACESVSVSNSDSQTTVHDFQEKDLMRSALEGYVRRSDGSFSLPPPDDLIVEKCLLAGAGATAEDIIQILRFLHQNGQSPGEPAGPKTWAWFPAVIGRRFSKEKAKGAVA